MKLQLLLIFAFLTVNVFSQDYYLKDNDGNKTTLADTINTAIATGKIKENPLIVVNDRVLYDDELDSLDFFKSDITIIEIVKKGNKHMAKFYGEKALNGILFIETKRLERLPVITLYSLSVLWILDGKEISRNKLTDIIDPDKDGTVNADIVKSVSVFKKKKDKAKYTSKNYRAVVIFESRNE